VFCCGSWRTAADCGAKVMWRIYMNERLIVKNFLCLEDIDIEVKDFLVIIGPQSAGKSLCAKLLYFFRTIFDEVVLYYFTTDTSKKASDFYITLADKFESFFPKSYWEKEDFYIEYHRGLKKEFGIKKRKKEKLEIYLNQRFLAIAQYIKPSPRNMIEFNDDKFDRTQKILKLLSNKSSRCLFIDNIFIPAGRSFFSLLQKNLFKFLRNNNNIDPFLVEFGVFYEDIKQTECNIPTEALTLIRSILKGEYLYSESLLRLADGKKVTPEFLSSGQQETLPLALVFAYIISLHLDSHKISNIYVEEPEAHLFPDAQEQISRLISFLWYNAKHEVTFAITTHSPYMLAAFNNLIKAGNLVKQNPGLKDAVCKEIPESMHIDIEHFSAYSLEGGRAASIIDEETHLINADAIDRVSESIMEIFNTLQDIEFDGGKAGNNV
jgi:predicted ATP-dependent endonuclease of OLD family